jgi:hypothetical protein
MISLKALKAVLIKQTFGCLINPDMNICTTKPPDLSNLIIPPINRDIPIVTTNTIFDKYMDLV